MGLSALDASLEELALKPTKAKGTTKSTGKKKIEDIYQKKTQLEHVLLRPDSYIGSTEKQTGPQWVYEEGKGMTLRQNTSFVPGLYKIFDEILVNAADNKQRDPSMNKLKITIDAQNNRITIWNNGKGIPVVIHKEEKIYVPELIFGHLLTSSNYDDNQKKVTGGRNGFGAKLCNIFSTKFIVETAEKDSKKVFKQVFKNNMADRSEPVITENKKNQDYTSITFEPDLKRFHMDHLDDDIIALFTKRAYDMAGVLRGVAVYINGEKINVRGFDDYIKLYLENQKEDTPVFYERIDDRWEVCITHSEGQFQQVSFVNSIATTKGGTHVTHACEKIISNLMEIITKKNKAAPVKPFQIKNHLWVFVNCLIENPAFDSQTKEALTLRQSAFGSKCNISEQFIKSVAKSGVVDKILSWAKFKQQTQLSKTCSGVKKNRLTGIPKLDDANMAGTRQSQKCTLILTEGDSAKTLAVSGLSVVGRDYYGVFPLKGKLLNVREANHKQITGNAEIQNVVTIMGLKYNHVYKDTSSLRYGSLMIMTDQDHDGSHIKGLLINFIHHFWPSLLKIPGFLVEFITPIVKATKGKNVLSFYTVPEYEAWKEETPQNGWNIKYYKGLGTSSPSEAKEYFSDMDRHQIAFEWGSENDSERIDLAFNKKRANDRKQWLGEFVPGTFLDQDIATLNYTDFINQEFILFSIADNMRSIPSVMDGFKPGQRKIMYACFKRKLKDELKVAQLAGYVAEHSAYHHGEQSLCTTIINMAQNFIGSNNINLLMPIGAFGSRLQGGKDASSPRYISTKLNPITRCVFPDLDDHILNYLDDDGQSIEPEWYCPIIPMALVNGSDGIGTGWRSTIPNYNPIDLVTNIIRKLEGQEYLPLRPYYNGFNGAVVDDVDKFRIYGTIHRIDDLTVQISELPVRVWTNSYKEFLDSLSTGDEIIIKDFREYHTDTAVNFVITLTEAGMKECESVGFYKKLKVEGTFSTTNYVLFDENGRIKKYDGPLEIMEAFHTVRLDKYRSRKAFLADQYTNEYDKLSNKVRFIKAIISGDIVVNNKKKQVLIDELAQKQYLKVSAKNEEDNNGYNYLLSMPLWNLTLEKVKALEAEKEKKERQLDELLNTTPQQLWRNDLELFLEEYEKHLTSFNEAPVAKSKAIGGKKTKAKGRAASTKAPQVPVAQEEEIIPYPAQNTTLKAKSQQASTVKKEPKLEEIDDMDIDEVEEKPKRKMTTSSKTTATSIKKEKVAPTLKIKKEEIEEDKCNDSESDSDSSEDDMIASLSKRLNTGVSISKAKPTTKRAAVPKVFESPFNAKTTSKSSSKPIPKYEIDGSSDEESYGKSSCPDPTPGRVVTKKSRIVCDSDDSDEFDSFKSFAKPVKPKAVAKAKAPAKKTAPKKAAAPKKTAAAPKKTVKKASPFQISLDSDDSENEVVEDDDSDDDFGAAFKAPARKPPAKKAPAKKSSAKKASAKKPAAKAAPKKPAAVKNIAKKVAPKKAVIADSSGEEEEVVVNSRSRRGRGAASSVKYFDDDDLDEDSEDSGSEFNSDF